jgi:hypothetical protein
VLNALIPKIWNQLKDMSHKYKVLIDASSIKYPNGLWFYALDLIFDLQRIGCKVYLVPPKFYEFNVGNIAYINKVTGFILSIMGRFQLAIVPTLAFRFYRRQYVIVHDRWPLIQSNTFKRMLANSALLILRFYSSIVAVSEAHASILKADFTLVNKFPTEPDALGGDDIECDYLIIGTETARKNLDKAVKLADNLSASKHLSGRLILVGSNDQVMGGLPKVKNLQIICLYPNEMGRVCKSEGGAIYISLSSEEGFNRGAAIALKKGFNLILSSIPAHREFFDGVANYCYLNNVGTQEPPLWMDIKLHSNFTLEDFSGKLAGRLDSQRLNVLLHLLK